MSRSASLWPFTVEDRGSIESAIVDKYLDLFATDTVLRQAWADYQDAERRINDRMVYLADSEKAERMPQNLGAKNG